MIHGTEDMPGPCQGHRGRAAKRKPISGASEEGLCSLGNPAHLGEVPHLQGLDSLEDQSSPSSLQPRSEGAVGWSVSGKGVEASSLTSCT